MVMNASIGDYSLMTNPLSNQSMDFAVLIVAFVKQLKLKRGYHNYSLIIILCLSRGAVMIVFHPAKRDTIIIH